MHMTRWLACGLIAILPASLRAEVVYLHDGGRVAGEVVDDSAAPDEVIVRLPGGGMIGLNRNDIRLLVPASEDEIAYRRLRDRAGDDAAAQLELAEWCLQHKLPEYARVHLLRVVRLEPNHTVARGKLGQAFRDGQWMSYEQRMRSQGYVRDRGRWRLPQAVALSQERAANKEAHGQWFRNVKLWSGWLLETNPKQQAEARENLLRIRDPRAMRALTRFLGDHPSPQMRATYVQVIANVDGAAAEKALVLASLLDEAGFVRSMAVALVARRQPAAALNIYARGLRDENNLIVRRSAEALGEMGDLRAVEPLIDALVTVHQEDLGPANSGTGTLVPFSSEQPAAGGAHPAQGGIPVYSQSGTAFSPNPPRRVAVYHVQNQEVVDALTKLSGQNFGFDAGVWRNWWRSYLDSQEQAVLEKP